MELPLILALIYMLWENYSLVQVVTQLRHNQQSYIAMLTGGKDSIDE